MGVHHFLPDEGMNKYTGSRVARQPEGGGELWDAQVISPDQAPGTVFMREDTSLTVSRVSSLSTPLAWSRPETLRL
jgi:hypothetical protein